MTKKSKQKQKIESVLQGAMLSPKPSLKMDAPAEDVAGLSAWISVPLAVVGCALIVFGLVRLIRFAWFW